MKTNFWRVLRNHSPYAGKKGEEQILAIFYQHLAIFTKRKQLRGFYSRQNVNPTRAGFLEIPGAGRGLVGTRGHKFVNFCGVT